MSELLAAVTTSVQDSPASSALLAFVTAAITFYKFGSTDPKSIIPDVAQDFVLAEYDFIIIGGGSAGN